MFSLHQSDLEEAHWVLHTQTWIISRHPGTGVHDFSGHILQPKEHVLPAPA